MMKRVALGSFVSAVLLSGGSLPAEEAPPPPSNFDFDVGADFRLRNDWKDNWMDRGTRTVNPNAENFYRQRTRVWGRAACGEDLEAYLRLANEFRAYRNSLDNDQNKFPDELFVDNLYADFKNVADRADVRIGRQDVKEGAGRVVSDGTPGDGSRSAYFNAVLTKVRLLEKSDVDLMGTWNQGHDTCTLGNPHDIYDLTKIKTGNPYSRMEEKGLMAYLHLNEVQDAPMELYWVWKQETRFYDKSTRYPGRDFHTLGARLTPKLTEKLSAEAEAAVQLGEIDGAEGMESRDIFAHMGYGALTYSEKEVWAKPRLTGAVLYLSGDEDSYYKTADGGTDNSWNPTFNRRVWFSDICATMYDLLRWSNLVYPHLETSVEPAAKHVVTLQTGPMFAAETDLGATDNYRGYYSQLRYDFPLLSKLFGKRGEVTGAIVGETLFYGDYYPHETGAADETAASFLRVELNGKF